MTNSFLKGIFNFREGERLPKFILPWKMKLNGEGLPSTLAGGMSCHFELAHEILQLSRLLKDLFKRGFSSDM